MKLHAISGALEFIDAFAGTGVAAIEALRALAKADIVAERGVHDFFQEAAFRILLRN